ncbi:MAG: rhomboid family intramembrane serine protease, partial [Gemmatimonadetes bacterium]|nr:rhomboid family intramembrane serine protease [Gemmatimonadota bacterium]NIS03176.1 rhomboid family intramembrane serine protease [Gemmatimonadota bacterium]NIT69075.1 rhomboid family intramembrane serine protease [Gemmatimonadota bacterium]NIU53586.1 rhomboid family intramembrane serine protease [Gemmatimonadota bacterium]NIV25558.1 rhomboid family intramembrane serine protease [Gemmatimonadota bacterium]
MRTAFRSGQISFGYRLTPWVKRLIIANAAFWLLNWTRLIPLELAVEYLGFTASEALKEPWTIITYMFVHGGFFHVFINMLMLFFFGPPLEERWGGKEFLKYYAICGVAGALFNVGAMAFGLGTGTIPIVGASGAVYGVMLAYALNWPNSLVWIYAIFPIKVKYLVIILGAMTFFSAFGGAADG